MKVLTLGLFASMVFASQATAQSLLESLLEYTGAAPVSFSNISENSGSLRYKIFYLFT